MNKIEILSCVVCGETDWKIDPEAGRVTRVRDGYNVIQCKGCEIRRLDPMPNQDELRGFYEDDSIKHEYIRQNSSAYVAGADTAAGYVDNRLSALATRLGGVGRILDIGSAQGAFLARARELGWTPSGLELSAEGVQIAREMGLAVDQKTLHEAAFAAESFDAVHLSHVLEHLPDPKETLGEIYRILRPGGVLAIEVPNEFDDLFGTMRAKVLKRERPAYVVPSPHVYYYVPRALARLVKNVGFEVFHHTTPRRNDDTASAYLAGRLVRSTIFGLEKQLLRGPNIEIYATRK